MKWLRQPAGHPVHLATGLTLWFVWLCLVYGGAAVACAFNLYELVDIILVAGASSHWLVPVLRKAVAKSKPKASDAEERL